MARVLATTLHLWLRRRVLRTPDGAQIAPRRWAAVVAAVVVVTAAIVSGVEFSHSPSRVAADHAHSRPKPTVNLVLATTAANEKAAAAWIIAQLGARTPVACDATMCGYLQAQGMPASQQVVLAAGESISRPATVVVVTPLVRTQSGSALAVSAPEILASFGNGPEQVLLRVTSAGGQAGYLAAARGTVHASARAGQTLAAGGRVQASVAAQRLLVSGRIDSRLLTLLSKLAATRVVYVAAFGDATAGATWPSPLRSVTLGHFTGGSDLLATASAVRALLAQFQATMAEQHPAGGVSELTIQVPAPSPL